MAIFRLEAKLISRGKQGRSVVAAAAYRAGKKLFGEREAKTHDYSRRSKGVVATTIVGPEGAPEWITDPAQLWNRVESCEKRVDAQLAREFIVALPKELPANDQLQLAVGWTREKLVSAGMVAQVSLHHPKDGENPHAHILCPTRRLDGEGFAATKAREWNDVKVLMQQRESWAEAVNAALERAGVTTRVDHRSLEAQGIDRLPEPKKGVAATAMKRRGVVEDPKRFQDARWVKLLNDVMPYRRAIEHTGEIKQVGVGRTWLERSCRAGQCLKRIAPRARTCRAIGAGQIGFGDLEIQ